jgi:hypothetical protein
MNMAFFVIAHVNFWVLGKWRSLWHCGSGGRAALAGKVLKDMGYGQVFNMGGFKDWADSGGPTE